MNGYTENNNEDHKKTYTYGRYKTPQVWEIYLADVPKVEGSHILCGKRPVIICSNETCNNTSTEINVYPLSSRIRNWIPTHITLNPDIDNGLKVKSQIYLEQGRTIPKKNLLEYWGRLTDFPLMLKIGRGIMMQNAMLQCMDVCMCWN